MHRQKSRSFAKIFYPYIEDIRQGRINSAQKKLIQMKQSFPARGWYHEGILLPLIPKNTVRTAKLNKKRLLCFEQSLSYDPKNAAAWRAQGNILFILKKYKEAELSFKKSLIHSRSMLYKNDARRFLADIALVNGNYKGALRLLNKVRQSKYRPPYIQLAPHYISIYKTLANKAKVKFWALKGITSTKIIEKSGKKPYGPKDTYQKVRAMFSSYLQ